MNRAPCPNCGEMLSCHAEEMGKRIHCPKCNTRLQLDRDRSSAWMWRYLRRSRVILAGAALLIFFFGLMIGFGLGQSSAPQGQKGGIFGSSFSIFGVSRTEIRVEDPKPPEPKK